jgi:hypothetical protein
VKGEVRNMIVDETGIRKAMYGMDVLTVSFAQEQS